jgi:acyl carrier protein
MEKIIADIWKEVLGLEKVGVHDDFFDLGGNSLLCIKITGKLKEAFNMDIPIVSMFRYLTIRSFARYLGKTEEVDRLSRKDRSEIIDDGKGRMKQTLKMMKKKKRQHGLLVPATESLPLS